MSKSIFNITNEWQHILTAIEEAEGEITEEVETALAINEGELKQKGIGYAAVIKSVDSESDIIVIEIKRLQALKKQNDNLVANLKERLSGAMTLYGINEIKTELNKINFRKSKSVVNYDADLLPSDCKIVQVVSISKTELKKRIDSGETIPGVRIESNKNIQIK